MFVSSQARRARAASQVVKSLNSSDRYDLKKNIRPDLSLTN